MADPHKLYDYQEDCVNIAEKNSKGIICLPTGAGKTLIQAHLIALDIIRHPKKFRMYAILAPRIMLSYQLMKEVYIHLMKSGIEARYMFVHSGGLTDIRDLEKIRIESTQGEIPFTEIESGTSPNLVRDTILKAKKRKMPIIFISTYNSAERIEQARFNKDEEDEIKIYEPVAQPNPKSFGLKDGKFPTQEKEDEYLDALRQYERYIHWQNKQSNKSKAKTTYQKLHIVMNDEAHYLIQERFYPILNILKSHRCYFFTATTIHTPSDKGRGMNNIDSYGEILYEMTPRDAIERGRMVRPRFHFILSKGATYTMDDFESSIGIIIRESFLQHQYALKGETQPKILVTTKGVGDIKRFMETKEYQKLLMGGINIYAVASDESIGNDINGEKVTRQEFLNRLKHEGRDRSKQLIVLHYDILAEGIDVSGFSGILPLRTLGKAKFLQTYGRAARLDYYDRERLEKGEITANDLGEFVKPYAWVIIPNIIHENEDNKDHFSNLINEMRSYGFNPSEDILVTDDINGLQKVEGVEGLNELRKKAPKIGDLIHNIQSKYEEEELASMTKDDWLYYLIKDLKEEKY